MRRLSSAAAVAVATLLVAGCAPAASPGDAAACTGYFDAVEQANAALMEARDIHESGVKLSRGTALRVQETVMAARDAARTAYDTAESPELVAAFKELRGYNPMQTSVQLVLIMTQQQTADACREHGVSVHYEVPGSTD